MSWDFCQTCVSWVRFPPSAPEEVSILRGKGRSLHDKAGCYEDRSPEGTEVRARVARKCLQEARRRTQYILQSPAGVERGFEPWTGGSEKRRQERRAQYALRNPAGGRTGIRTWTVERGRQLRNNEARTKEIKQWSKRAGWQGKTSDNAGGKVRTRALNHAESNVVKVSLRPYDVL